ncbi:MAG: NAD-dependent deacylase [Chloroflexi bacterium]|nr:NAD-dependent deacylase [Chloroflexota bacterium]
MDISPELIRILREARRVAALTGAGISAESGLRTFRDAQTGHWAQYRPEELATPGAFRRNPKLVWDWYAMRRGRVAEVEPNPGHYALVEMAQHVPHFTLVTQNVDGLHVQAGSRDVIELHGNIQRVKCFDGCGVVETWEETDDVPRCSSCGAYLRPDVVWFGESLPFGALESAVEAARACDVFFSIGTSGVVQPAASLAYEAKNRGAVVVEINLEPTPLSGKAEFALHGKSGDVLPALIKRAWG